MWIPAAEVALLGGLLCLDRITLQVMLSRPVVAGPIVGFVLGDPMTGLVAGAMIELLWIDRFHMGRYIPPNDTVVSVLVTAGAILAAHDIPAPGSPPQELVAAAVLLFAPVAFLAQWGDKFVASSNDALAERALEDARRGDVRAIARKHYFGMAKTFAMSSLVIFLCLVAGTLLLRALFPVLPERVLSALAIVYYGIPVLGMSVALSTIKVRGALPVFSGVFLVAVIAIRLWQGGV